MRTSVRRQEGNENQQNDEIGGFTRSHGFTVSQVSQWVNADKKFLLLLYYTFLYYYYYIYIKIKEVHVISIRKKHTLVIPMIRETRETKVTREAVL